MKGDTERRPRWVRRARQFVLNVLAMLVIGVVIEKVTELTAKDTAQARGWFVNLERNAAASVARLEPAIAVNLWRAGMEPTGDPVSVMMAASEKRYLAGHPERAPPPVYRSDAELETGVKLGHWAGPVTRSSAILAPVLALADVVWHLITTGHWVARIMVLGQIALGGIATATSMIWLADRKIALDGILPAPVFAIGTVLLASASAYLTGYVITGAQAALGWLSHIAGMTVGFGALASGCVAFFQKSVELTVHKRIETLIDKA